MPFCTCFWWSHNIPTYDGPQIISWAT
jgi:hypothetical protein